MKAILFFVGLNRATQLQRVMRTLIGESRTGSGDIGPFRHVVGVLVEKNARWLAVRDRMASDAQNQKRSRTNGPPNVRFRSTFWITLSGTKSESLESIGHVVTDHRFVAERKNFELANVFPPSRWVMWIRPPPVGKSALTATTRSSLRPLCRRPGSRHRCHRPAGREEVHPLMHDALIHARLPCTVNCGIGSPSASPTSSVRLAATPGSTGQDCCSCSSSAMSL